MKFIRSLSVYTLTNVLNSGISFFLMPIYTHYLSPEDIGVLGLFTVGIALIMPFIQLSSHGAIQIEYYKLEKEDFSTYVSSAFFNNLISFAGIIVLTFSIGPFISDYLKLPFSYFWLIPVIAFLQILPQVLLIIFQAKHEALNYAKFNLSQAVLNMLLGLALVIVFHMNWDGRILSLFITYLVFFLIGFLILRKRGLLNLKFNTTYSRSALAFGLPLLPHAIGSLIIDSSDRLFITKMVSVADLGIYNVGYQIAMIIGLLEVSFNQAFLPYLFEFLKTNSPESKVKVVKFSYVFLVGLLLAVIALHFGSYFIFGWLIDEKFAGAQKFVFWIGLGYFFSGIYKVFVGPIFYLKKTYILSYIAILNICLNLLLNYFFIKEYGAIGAAYATTISYMVVALLIIIISNRFYKLPWFTFNTVHAKGQE